MRKRKNKRRKQSFVLILTILLLVLVLSGIIYLLLNHDITYEVLTKPLETLTELLPAPETEIETETEPQETETEAPERELTAFEAFGVPENEIHTFMQGPKAWESKAPWSGSWCKEELADSVFSVFGCGHCCTANIYGTFSPYECSPLDMYYYARKVTDYSPGGGYGAIDWPYMKQVLKKTGFSSYLGKKDKSYEKFRDKVIHSLTAIVLVSSYNDSTYWHDTEGHYVTIWNYHSEDDTVFLGDSGDPAHNRARIPLRYIYDALKTSGSYQYLMVESYEEEKNEWKYSGIKEAWTIPKDYVLKEKRNS